MNPLTSSLYILTLAGLTLFGPSAHASKDCLPQPNMVCEVIGSIHLYTENKDDLKRLRSPIEYAQHSFETYFGLPVPLGAVIERNLKTKVGIGVEKTLKNRDIEWSLPWSNEEEIKEFKANLVRSELNIQMPNLSEEKLDALVKQTLSTQSVSEASDKASMIMESTLQHEIGHLLFMHSFWPNTLAETKNEEEHVYGAQNSPDWLDEVAAILLEEDQLTENRRTDFKRLVNELGVENLIPFSKYLSMDHPALAELAKSKIIQDEIKRVKSTGSSGLVVLTGKDIDKLGATEEELREEGDFYSFSRAFADFMLETSGDQRIFSHIASAIKSGKNIESWLSSQTTPLPKKMNELERAWLDWVNKNYVATSN
jgi:hypothetical protein